MKNLFSLVEQALFKFVGTVIYYKFNENLLITEGVYYLVQKFNAYWLINIAIDNIFLLNNEVNFIVIKVYSVDNDQFLKIEDGNGCLLISKKLSLLDLTLLGIEIYGNKERNVWVLMLPSEY
jgi:hypothetical protein